MYMIYRNAYKMYIRCIQDVYKMYTRCIQDVYKMYTRCVQDVYTMYIRCIQDEYKMYTRCIQDVHKMCMVYLGGCAAFSLSCTLAVTSSTKLSGNVRTCGWI